MLEEILDISESGFFEATGKPIIIVPPMVQQGNLCLLNAKRFFWDGKYKDGTPLQDKAWKEDNFKDKDTFKYPIPMKTSYESETNKREIAFEVYDSVTSFTKKQWKWVVAVFLSG